MDSAKALVTSFRLAYQKCWRKGHSQAERAAGWWRGSGPGRIHWGWWETDLEAVLRFVLGQYRQVRDG